MYFDFSSRPDTLNLRCGNIWLQERRKREIIINSIQSDSVEGGRKEGEGEGGPEGE